MAGTMPHAIFVETGLHGGATVAAYAAELPGCATFAAGDGEAVAAIPHRVLLFSEWLRRNGETVPAFIGDNWYEVERAACDGTPLRRAAFSLDELPPSDDEWQRWLRWLELAREELAEAIDRGTLHQVSGDAALSAIADQDDALIRSLGGEPVAPAGSPMDRFYAAHDALIETLEAGGPSTDGGRRALRLAIADDLRLADRLRGEEGWPPARIVSVTLDRGPCPRLPVRLSGRSCVRCRARWLDARVVRRQAG